MVDIFDAFGRAFGLGEKVTIIAQSQNGEKRMVVFDAASFETHKATSKATKHEIEDGSEVNDHVIKEGRTYELQGIVSDYPVTLTNALVSNVAGITGVIASKTSGLNQRDSNILAAGTSILSGVLVNLNQGKPSKEAVDALDEIHEKSIPLTIISGLKTYTNMIMEENTVNVTPRTANVLSFTGSFREIRVVRSQTVLVPVEAVIDGGTEEQDAGEKKATLNSITDPDNRTGLFAIGEAIFGELP